MEQLETAGVQIKIRHMYELFIKELDDNKVNILGPSQNPDVGPVEDLWAQPKLLYFS